MPTLKELTATLQSLTGIPAFTIERTADELASAGYLPDSPTDTISYLDAANLIVALAAGRSPAEAAELLGDYARLPASSIICQDEGAPDRQLDAAAIADLAKDTNAFDSPMSLVAELMEQAADKKWLALAAEIARGPSLKRASFLHDLAESDLPPRRLIEFAAPAPRGEYPWSVSTRISGEIFTEIARLFHRPSRVSNITNGAMAWVQ